MYHCILGEEHRCVWYRQTKNRSNTDLVGQVVYLVQTTQDIPIFRGSLMTLKTKTETQYFPVKNLTRTRSRPPRGSHVRVKT